MEVKVSKVLRVHAAFAVALFVFGCGSNTSRQVSPPTGTSQASPTAPSGPSLASWWDTQSKGLRVVYGVPGASIQAATTYANDSYTGAATCMRKNLALFTSAAGNLDAASLPVGEPMTVAQGAAPNATLAFSPSCNAALAYTPAGTQGLLIQGLAANPKTGSVTLPSGTLAAIVADSGTILTASPAKDGSVALQSIAFGGAPQSVTTLSTLGGMAFLPGADSAIVADSAANTVIEASRVTGALSLTQIAASQDGVGKPTAIGISADARWVAVANGKDGSVLRLDLASQTSPSRTICNCSPTKLEPLAGNFAFRLNDPGTGTVWAFDGAQATPRIVFLPAAQSTAATQGAMR